MRIDNMLRFYNMRGFYINMILNVTGIIYRSLADYFM